jgi:mannose-1-phosphate guanylyltransferase
VVLAAGEGTRLAALTRDKIGRAVPKQYCSLRGGRSLLLETMQRAERLVSGRRSCVIVAAQHRRYWEPSLAGTPGPNIFVQPENRGTAIGVLLSVMHVMTRDPDATLLFLPADHHVADEEAMTRGLEAMLRAGEAHPDALMLLGIQPEDADSELGYIIPARPAVAGARAVARFVEKPSMGEAMQLLRTGAAWNSFIFSARASTLLAMFERRMPQVCESVRAALVWKGLAPDALEWVYRGLPTVDFSRHVLQVVVTDSCGWTDLGTPRRVAETLQRAQIRVPSSKLVRFRDLSFVDLSVQHERRQLPA